jgi:hypothetical protein
LCRLSPSLPTPTHLACSSLPRVTIKSAYGTRTHTDAFLCAPRVCCGDLAQPTPRMPCEDEIEKSRVYETKRNEQHNVSGHLSLSDSEVVHPFSYTSDTATVRRKRTHHTNKVGGRARRRGGISQLSNQRRGDGVDLSSSLASHRGNMSCTHTYVHTQTRGPTDRRVGARV